MIRRIEASTVPSFLLMQYAKSTWNVTNLWAVHHSLITPAAIEPRKALAPTARRAGWIGCNIVLSLVPPEGRIPLVMDSQATPRRECRRRFAIAERLEKLSPDRRGWAAIVLTLLHDKGKQRFTINDAYTLETQLSRLYPANRNVRPKIRQQLQILRDAGLIIFESRGVYRFTNST
jgi:type II restriction enzyme